MGLIKAVGNAISGTLADQWKEFFYCEALPVDVLCVKGQKQTSKRSVNNKGEDNIISSGSGIAVADGQCMIIVEQGRIVEICSEPGAFTWDASTEPSCFSENLFKGIGDIIKTAWKRIGYGGIAAKDQRVYYFNTKELLDNKFGTMNPVPFRVVDSNIGMDIDVSIKCCGTFSYRISNPILFYQNVCGNVTEAYRRSQIDAQLKQEFMSALQPGFGALSDLEIRPNQVVRHTKELEKGMNDALADLWANKRGLEIVSIAISSITLPQEDQEMIKNAQRQAIYRNPGMAGAMLAEQQGKAMEKAAGNSAGAMQGFFGMGMAQQAGGMNANAMFAMDQQQQQARAAQQAQQQAAAAPAANSWKCPSCGASATGKFCPECGTKKPEEAAGWTCSCGAVNKGRFCAECGSKKPEGAPLYKCDKCGWEPEDPKNPPKFCPECGDIFDANDIKK